MSVEERRRDIIAATVPLLEEEGFAVSTRRIADAAGIAEGTVFRVFSTKQELLRAAVNSVMDPADLIARIDAIDPAGTLEEKLSEVLDIVQESATRVQTFMMAMRGRSFQAAMKLRARMGADASSEGRLAPGATLWNSFGLKIGQAGDGAHGLGQDVRTDFPGTDDPHHPHHQFATHAGRLRDAIAATLAPHAAEVGVDLDVAATYILTTGLASLMARSAFPAMDTDTVAALTLRALTNPRKGTE
ncbi:MAG: TetR/AcrR family transcriptional regulator [Propionibacteriaceae bacterium]|nr:TetR/AcrR family transcriptional regulator [Propionibacteriaceae bacterium]